MCHIWLITKPFKKIRVIESFSMSQAEVLSEKQPNIKALSFFGAFLTSCCDSQFQQNEVETPKESSCSKFICSSQNAVKMAPRCLSKYSWPN